MTPASHCEPRTRLIDCPSCNGEREHEVVTGIDRRYGGFTGYVEKCSACDGTGTEEVELEAITLDDLDQMAGG